MTAFGLRARISSAVIVCGTISEYTLHSRTRRAISCAYCAPKSTTRTVSCSGVTLDRVLRRCRGPPLRHDGSVDDLARQRAATYRFWREDVGVRPAGAWADLDGVQVHTTGLAPRHWNGAHMTRSTDLAAVLPRVAQWFADVEKPWGLLIPSELELTPPGLTYATDQKVMLLRLDALREAPLAAGIAVTERAPPADVAQVQSEAYGDPYDVTLAFVAPTLGPNAAPPQQTLTAYDVHEP